MNEHLININDTQTPIPPIHASHDALNDDVTDVEAKVTAEAVVDGITKQEVIKAPKLSRATMLMHSLQYMGNMSMVPTRSALKKMQKPEPISQEILNWNAAVDVKKAPRRTQQMLRAYGIDKTSACLTIDQK